MKWWLPCALSLDWRAPFFYIPADTKFRACTLITCGSYHYIPKNWNVKTIFFISQNRFLIIQNQFSDITNSTLTPKNRSDFVISQNQFSQMIFWYQKITMILWDQKFYFVISQNRICDTTKSKFVISQISFWYHKIEFVIKKIEFVVSQNRGFIVKRRLILF